ncbi:hypothetical protein ACFWUP_21195 [Nocardia sp. NPDC058658]
MTSASRSTRAPRPAIRIGGLFEPGVLVELGRRLAELRDHAL